MKKKIYLNTLKDEEVIERLKNGGVIHSEGNNCKIKMMEGVIVTKFKDVTQFGMGFTVYSHNDYYFEEDEKFEIKETGLYKTRDGRKAFVYRIDKNLSFSVDYCIENGLCESATEYGFSRTKYCECDNDLVSKWEE